MSRKRYLLLLTEAQRSTVVQAMTYVRDVSGVDGDVSDQWASANERVREIVIAAPLRDAHADMRALRDASDLATGNSCSCVELRAKGHARDCIVTTHRSTFDRIEALRKLFET